MNKNYKDYCREALARDPKVYSSVINPDGSVKMPPRVMTFSRKKVLKEIPDNDLQKIKRDGWKPAVIKVKKSEIKITGTEIKIKKRKLNLDILELPKKTDRREYNKIWMHNSRVRQRIEKLKEKYKDSTLL